LTNPKLDEREVALDMLESDPTLFEGRHGQVLIGDKGYASTEFELRLGDHGVELIRSAKKGEKPRRGHDS